MMALSLNPALIVLDHDSPTPGAGLEVCKALKRSAFSQLIPVILLLEVESVTERLVALELGAEDCLAKSQDLRELVLRIQRALLRSSQNLQSEQSPRKRKR